MTRDEFKRQLDQLREVIDRALGYYAVWKAVKLHDKDAVDWSLEDRNGVLGRFKGFFTPVAFALLDMAKIEFAKVFDKNPRTASMTNLLTAAQGEPVTLVPHLSASDLRKVASGIDENAALLETLRQARNQRLAHLDRNPAPVGPLMTKDFDKFVEGVKLAFNTLARGHDRNVFSWEHSVKESERHTAEILGILLDDRDRKRQEFDDTMVGIGLGELRRVEETMGGRVNWSEARSFIQSFGLTPDQMKRVESEYSAGIADGSPE